MEDAARVMWSGGGASAMLRRRVDGVAVLCVVQFQPIRASQNAGGEQEWLLRLVLNWRRCDR